MSEAFGDPTSDGVRAEYYGEIGCTHCDDFVDKTLPAAERRAGVSVDLESFDILSAAGYERCRERLAGFGIEFKIFPVLVIGNNVYQGNSAIESNLEGELVHFAREGFFRPKLASEAREGPLFRMAAAPIFLAGLVDGINPCAFTTLLFFLSFISLRGGTRKSLAGAGLLFAAGVFLSYLAIGLGLFNIIRAGFRMSGLRLALRVLVSGATAAFCLLTIRDLSRARAGRQGDMLLQLPPAIKRLIHTSIRNGVRGAVFPLGVFVSGAVVAVLELACTGQVYFPTLSYMVQTDTTLLGLGSLLLYNLAFISPLLAVLFLLLAGMSQETVRRYFERHLALAKGALAFTFAVLAVLVWIF